MAKEKIKLIERIPFIMLNDIIIQHDNIRVAVVRKNMYYYIPIVKPIKTKTGYSFSVLKTTNTGLNLLSCKKVKLKVHSCIRKQIINNLNPIKVDAVYPDIIVTVSFKEFLNILNWETVDENILHHINSLVYDAITLLSYDNKVMGYVICH